jgi:hypothetical protein
LEERQTKRVQIRIAHYSYRELLQCSLDESGYQEEKHIGVGDFVLNGFCVPCFDLQDYRESTSTRVYKQIIGPYWQSKRDIVLNKWANHRKQIVQLSCKQWSRKETAKVVATIEHRCYKQTWDERLEELRKRREQSAEDTA